MGERNKDNLFLRSGLVIIAVTALFCLTQEMPAMGIAFMAFTAFILAGTGMGLCYKKACI